LSTISCQNKNVLIVSNSNKQCFQVYTTIGARDHLLRAAVHIVKGSKFTSIHLLPV